MAAWIKIPLGTELGLSPGDFVLDGDAAPPPKRGDPQIFGPCLLRPNGWMHQGATWYGGRPRPRPHCVTWESSSPKRGTAPHFLVHVNCGKTAGLTKTPLNTEVDLGSGHVELHGVPALRQRGTAVPPLFGPCLLWPRSPISATAELLLTYLTPAFGASVGGDPV